MRIVVQLLLLGMFLIIGIIGSINYILTLQGISMGLMIYQLFDVSINNGTRNIKR
jgi:hypothetical protein